MRAVHGNRGRHESSRRHGHQHRSHAGLPPYYDQRSSSGSLASLPRHHRPPSVASVGAWIKSKGTDWYNQTDPFGAMASYLSSVRHWRGKHGHRHRRRHDDRDEERRHHHHRHRHHRRHDDDGVEVSRRHHGREDRHHRHHKRKDGHFFIDGMPSNGLEMADRMGSSSFSDIVQEKVTRKKRRARHGNDLQRRDRVVVVCFIVVNCIFAAIGLGVAIMAGLAEWQPQAYRSFYSSEVKRVFADMVGLKTACGRDFENFLLEPGKILPGVFNIIFAAGIGLLCIAIYGLVIPLIASRSPALQALHVALHIFYILLVMGLTGVTAAFLCIYFQEVDSIEARLRNDAKSSYIERFLGNPTQTCDPTSNFVNFMHRYFRCCGVDDGDDFADAYDWHGTIVITGDGSQYNERKPLSCCRLGRYYDTEEQQIHGEMMNVKGEVKGWMIDLCRRKDAEQYFFSRRTSYKNDGCFPIIKEFFKQPAQIGLISLGVFCLIMLFASTLSFLQTRLC